MITDTFITDLESLYSLLNLNPLHLLNIHVHLPFLELSVFNFLEYQVKNLKLVSQQSRAQTLDTKFNIQYMLLYRLYNVH